MRKSASIRQDAMSLEECQGVALGVLDELDRFCEENGIEYYLIGGALIGAVRGGDLVPWDDDIDVAMKRDDYERFKKEYVDGEAFSLFSYDKTEGYRHCVAKLADNRTVFVEPTAESCPFGVFVDVFPLDYADAEEPEHIESIWRRVREYNYSYVVSPAAVKGSAAKRLARSLLHFLHRNRPHVAALREIEEAMRRDGGSRLVNYFGAWREKEIALPEWFDGASFVELRGKEYSAPKDYHSWLNQVYGDYMNPPKTKPHYHGHAFWI